MPLRDNCKITAAILKSGIKSLDDYVEITEGDSGVYYTPEYWYTVNIFKGISKNTHYIPILENDIKELREYSREVQSGKASHKLRLDGKADIGIWTKSSDPIGIVEIKRGWNWDGRRFNSDVERLASALNNFGKTGKKSGSLRSGFFVIISDKWNTPQPDSINYFESNYAIFLTEIRKVLNSEKHGPFKLVGDYECTKYDKKNERMSAVFVFKVS